MSPLITVILTVYKRADFIAEALLSVQAQTMRDYEVIVTDDSDSPGIKAICDGMNNPAIRYRSNKVNLGVTLNLKAAISEAEGKFISILNDDDAWETEFLEKLSRVLLADERRVLVFSDHWIMDGDGAIDVEETDANTRAYGRADLPAGEVKDPADLVIGKNGIPLAMASMFRKDALDTSKLVSQVTGAYDYWIACLFAASGRPVHYVPERLTRYRIHSQMETKRKAHDKNENLVFIFGTLLRENAFPAMKTLLTKQYSESLRTVANDSLKSGQLDKARGHFIRSIKASFSLKALAGLGISYLPRAMRAIFRL